jgi:tyrosyl-tRNA synthetase
VNPFADLEARGLIHQVTEHESPLRSALDAKQTVYAGFDPSAASLHVGNLVPLLGLVRFQRAGHKASAGGGRASGLVGAPDG